MRLGMLMPLLLVTLLATLLGGSLVTADEVHAPLATAQEDIYIDDAQPDTNLNGQRMLVVSSFGNCVNQVLYLKFNVGTGAPISGWVLTLQVPQAPASTNISSNIGVFGVPNVWAEGTLTYNQATTLNIIPKTAACGGSSVALTQRAMPGGVGPYTVSWPTSTDLDNYVNAARGSDGIVSLALAHVSPAGLTVWVNTFCDKESAAAGQVGCTQAPLRVSLLALDATVAGRSVVLEWSTASELNNEGFNLYRSEAEDGEYVKINQALIPAQGNPSTGASYSFVDTDVRPGRTYYYKLEDVDTSGNSTFHGPVSATVPGKGR